MLRGAGVTRVLWVLGRNVSVRHVVLVVLYLAEILHASCPEVVVQLDDAQRCQPVRVGRIILMQDCWYFSSLLQLYLVM